jgi:hypothetical protein
MLIFSICIGHHHFASFTFVSFKTFKSKLYSEATLLNISSFVIPNQLSKYQANFSVIFQFSKVGFPG